MATDSEVPLLATSGPTGSASTLRIVATVMRFTSLGLFLSGGLFLAFFRTTTIAPGVKTLVFVGSFLLGLLLSVIRIFTIDVYVLRRTGRADVFADKVVIYKGEFT